MKINSPVRIRDGSITGPGVVIAISKDLRNVWVKWPRKGVVKHAPEELEVIEEQRKS